MRRLVVLLGAAAGACALPLGGPDSSPQVTWRGEVRITDDVVLPRGTRLVVEPGTVVRFACRDDDGDGWGDASLRVEGELVAVGTPESPIVFTSESEPAEPGLWGEIRVDFGRFDVRYAVIEGSTRGLHAHFCRGSVRDCVFRRNVDGTRFGESALEVEHCLFAAQEGKGLNARRCRGLVRANLFRGNRHGVFLFEGDEGTSFEANAFVENETPFRLGDFFDGVVSAPGNDWGPGEPWREQQTESASIEGSQGSAPGAGPRAWALLEPAWQTPVEGFVDARPVAADEGVYVAAWGGKLTRLGLLDGRELAAHLFSDPLDADPALGREVVAAQCWDRGIYALTRPSLEVLDVHREAESPADDHRQSSPLFVGSRLYAATWAGAVRAFETRRGRLEELWSFRAQGPFRAGLRVVGDVLLAPCQDGTVYALGVEEGRLLWAFRSEAPFLSGAATDGARVYLADRQGVMRALDLATGRALWASPLGAEVWYAEPLLAGGYLYQGDDGGRISALDPGTGRLLARRTLGGAVRSRPEEVEGTAIAVATGGGRLYLLAARTLGELDWLQAAGPLLSSPTAVGSRLVLGGRDGLIRAVDVRTRSVDEQ